jgi:hypothetical protein
MDPQPVDLTAQSAINFARPTPPPHFDERPSRNRTVPRKDISEWLVAHSGGVFSSTTHVVSVVAALVFFVFMYLWWVIAHATPGPLQLPDNLLPKTPSGAQFSAPPSSPGVAPGLRNSTIPPVVPRPPAL